jgi:FkbM family methyltransferase
MENKLIYDVGVHDGTDTAYYLRCGLKVVGIEANPVMVDYLKKKFSDELINGRLTLINAAIAECEGESEFWVCDDMSEWSSFDIKIASRNGAKHHCEIVKTCRFSNILSEFGVPYYCKVDIEGNDRLCIKDLDNKNLPKYFSVEMSHKDGCIDIDLLSELGYKYFKIISQSCRSQTTNLSSSIFFALPRLPRKVFRRLDKKFRGVSRDIDWKFPINSSGPFGETTPGLWKSRSEVLALWQHLHDLDERHNSKGLDDWYDIHAKL